jgi:hypothetical protein
LIVFFDVLKTKFKEYCEPRKNLTYIRHVFFTRIQGQHESIDSYVTDLKTKAKPCEFEHLLDGLIRDRIVCGIQNEESSKFNAPGGLSCSMFLLYTLTPCNVYRHNKMALFIRGQRSMTVNIISVCMERNT